MRFLDLSLLANGDLFRSELVAPADLDPVRLGACKALLSVTPTKSPLASAGWDDLVLQQTLSQDMGLLTVWNGSQIAASAILLAGTDPADESELLNMFYDSIANTRAAVAANASDTRYAEFHSEERRPVVFQVIWPAAAEAQNYNVEAVARYFAAVFFQVLGVERNA